MPQSSPWTSELHPAETMRQTCLSVTSDTKRSLLIRASNRILTMRLCSEGLYCGLFVHLLLWKLEDLLAARNNWGWQVVWQLWLNHSIRVLIRCSLWAFHYILLHTSPSGWFSLPLSGYNRSSFTDEAWAACDECCGTPVRFSPSSAVKGMQRSFKIKKTTSCPGDAPGRWEGSEWRLVSVKCCTHKGKCCAFLKHLKTHRTEPMCSGLSLQQTNASLQLALLSGSTANQ